MRADSITVVAGNHIAVNSALGLAAMAVSAALLVAGGSTDSRIIIARPASLVIAESLQGDGNAIERAIKRYVECNAAAIPDCYERELRYQAARNTYPAAHDQPIPNMIDSLNTTEDCGTPCFDSVRQLLRDARVSGASCATSTAPNR